MLRNYLKNNQSQLDSLEALEDFGVHNSQFAVAIGKVLHYLYEQDILSEDTILEWYANPPNDPSAPTSVRTYVSSVFKQTFK